MIWAVPKDGSHSNPSKPHIGVFPLKWHSQRFLSSSRLFWSYEFHLYQDHTFAFTKDLTRPYTKAYWPRELPGRSRAPATFDSWDHFLLHVRHDGLVKGSSGRQASFGQRSILSDALPNVTSSKLYLRHLKFIESSSVPLTDTNWCMERFISQ